MTSKYVTSKCDTCNGTGEHFDITCADKVNAGPFAGRCSTCQGSGTTSRLRRSIEREAREAAELKERLVNQVIGEIPDWML